MTSYAPVGATDRTAWRVVAMISVLYALSAIDRLILSLLVVPIKAELLISDTQIGVLFGLSFAVLYTLAGLPLARIADCGNRRHLIFYGVLFWSASTMASAFATDFTSLVLCRAGVAIGEAVLTPAAISMIADLFPRERRGTPTGVYTASGTITGMAAALIGGLVLALAAAISSAFGGMAPWRLTLLLVGAPGVLLAFLFAAIVAEPARGEAAAASREPVPGSGHLARHWPFYAALFGAVGLSVAIAYALIGWVPSLLVRRFGLATSEAGYLFGTLGVLAGGSGTLGTPALVGWLERRGRRDAVLVAGVIMCIVAAPAVVVAVLAPTLPVFIAALAVTLVALPGLTLLPSLVVQQVTPPRQRAQVVALYLLVSNLLGLGVGPALAGVLSDTVFRSSGGMGPALATIGAVALTGATILLLLARAPYRRLTAATA